MIRDKNLALKLPPEIVGKNSQRPTQSSIFLNYNKVRKYWNNVKPSVLGPYMMEGFGFPLSAGFFRFQKECKIVSSFIREFDSSSSVLDLGSGVGFWTQFFSNQFSKIVSVEASDILYKELHSKFASNPRIRTIQCDVLQFAPKEKFKVVFLGGLLMYLNRPEVETLLRRISSWLEPGGVIICRESTVRTGQIARKDDYQVVYRSQDEYRKLFLKSGYTVSNVIPNTPYLMLQMASELIKKWRALVPKQFWGTQILGRLFYWVLRPGYPFTTSALFKVLTTMGVKFPKLTNHFFVMRPK